MYYEIKGIKCMASTIFVSTLFPDIGRGGSVICSRGGQEGAKHAAKTYPITLQQVVTSRQIFKLTKTDFRKARLALTGARIYNENQRKL